MSPARVQSTQRLLGMDERQFGQPKMNIDRTIRCVVATPEQFICENDSIRVPGVPMLTASGMTADDSGTYESELHAEGCAMGD